ncbi:MAG: hypothetical protein PF549_01645 [Patescibacteria group bacterium]|jgi:hypothetical protein|nr:hypothetical protein [Patescibacteria group bacterium]
MKNKKNKIAELIYKLSLSGLPPSFQDCIISNISQLNDSRVKSFIEVLDELSEKEVCYLKSAEKYKKFLSSISDELKKDLKAEAGKIKKELMQELTEKNNVARSDKEE